MHLQQIVDAFFARHITYDKPLLIALSGGADSRCLLELVVAHKKRHLFELIVVHVDHGWRKESGFECKELQKLCTSLGLICHTKKLDPTQYQENIEAEARKERLQFFTEIAKETDAQGILLAHHGNDLAETFFKRMLEGASLYSLYGMSERSTYNSLTLFRPLLQVSKNDLVAYLRAHSISYYEDRSNADPKFLRARQRTQIFPYVQDAFGKSFEKNLCRQANDSYELYCFLENATKPYFEHVLKGPFGSCYEAFPKELFLLKFMVKKIAALHGCSLSRTEHESICTSLIEKKANKQTICSDLTLLRDRGILFVLEKSMPDAPQALALHIGMQRFGPWEVTVSECQGKPSFFNHWKHVFSGESITSVPKGAYVLSPLKKGMRRIFFHENAQKTTKLTTNFLNEKKTPHFFSSSVPVLLQAELVVEDFLTGQRSKAELDESFYIVKMLFRS